MKGSVILKISEKTKNDFKKAVNYEVKEHLEKLKIWRAKSYWQTEKVFF